MCKVSLISSLLYRNFSHILQFVSALRKMYKMVHQRFSPSVLSSFKSSSLIFRLGIVLKNRIEPTLICFYFLMSHIVSLCTSFPKRLFGSLILLIHMHLRFPSIQTRLILLENHPEVSINIIY